MFAGACARADTPLENVFVHVRVPPSACYILHNDADISNTASRRVPGMFGSQQDGRKGKYFNMRKEGGGGRTWQTFAVSVCVRACARRLYNPYLLLAGYAPWN